MSAKEDQPKLELRFSLGSYSVEARIVGDEIEATLITGDLHITPERFRIMTALKKQLEFIAINREIRRLLNPEFWGEDMESPGESSDENYN